MFLIAVLVFTIAEREIVRRWLINFVILLTAILVLNLAEREIERL